MSCRHHLYLEVNPATGHISVNSPVPPEEMTETCALDVAEEGGQTLEAVGEALGGLTRERVRQIEIGAIESLQAGLGLDDVIEVRALLRQMPRTRHL